MTNGGNAETRERMRVSEGVSEAVRVRVRVREGLRGAAGTDERRG